MAWQILNKDYDNFASRLKNNHKRCSVFTWATTRRSILLPGINIVQHACPWTTRYYSALFHFVRVLRIVNMLNDTDAACVAIALALCLKKVRNCRWIKKWFQRRPQCTHKKPHDRLNDVWAKRIFFFCRRFDRPSFDGLVKTVTTTMAKEILTC